MSDDHGTCPHCGADMNGGMIWAHFYQRLQDDGYYTGATPLSPEEAELEADRIAAQYGATRLTGRWGRKIGIYNTDLDRTTHYECPDCKGRWDR